MWNSREEAERYIINCCLTEKSLAGYVQGRLGAEHFTRYRAAWQKLLSGDREQVGQAISDFPGPDFEKLVNATHFLKVCRSLDRVKALSQSALKGLSNGAWKNPEQFLTRFALAAQSLEIPSSVEESVFCAQEWLQKGYEKLKEASIQGPAHFNLGLSALSEAVLPERGHLVITAAETGKGKTALTLNIAANLGARQKIPTLYVNTEMAWWELAYRLYALLGAGDLTGLRLGKADLERVREVRDAFGDSKLYITDALPWAEVNEILALAREYRARHGVEVLILDYIQRLESSSRDLEHWEVFLQAARQLKSLAQQAGMLVIMVAQLNDGKQLAGSRGMAREADTVLIMEEAKEPEAFETHVITVAKSRHTRTGTKIPVMLNGGTLAVEEIGGADS